MEDSEILPHGKLEQLADDLWILEGSLPHKIPLPRTMTIFRYPDGRLWIHSPVAARPETEEEIEALGTPTWVIVPNGMHRMDVGHYKLRWPNVRVICPSEAREAVEKKVPVDNVSEKEFRGDPVRALPMAGVKREELAYEIELASGKALVVTDLIVNVDRLPGLVGKFFELTGRIGRFRVPEPQKYIFLYGRKIFKSWLSLMAKKNFSIITLAHGRPVTGDASQWLRKAAESL